MTDTATRMTFDVPDISCGHCEMTIHEEVGALAGVKTVRASNQSKTVEVEFESSAISADDIRTALAEAGYPARN